MRLKASLNIPGANKFQLRKYCPERWLPSQESEDKTKNVCHDVKCTDYNPNMDSSPTEVSAVDQTTTRYLSAEHSSDTEDEEDNSTDSDFSETSPLLADFEEDSVDEDEEIEGGIDDYNNNLRRSVQSSQDSLLSDAFNMSALKDHLAVENFRNNNNLSSLSGLFSRQELSGEIPFVEEKVRGSFLTSTEEAFPSREIDKTGFSESPIETVCPNNKSKTTILPNSSSNVLTMASHVQTQYLPDVLPLTLKHQDITLNDVEGTHLNQEISPMSDSSASSDNDVNLATHSFNNFTLSASKHNDILYLVQEEKKPKEINILETEPKILNTTSSSLPRNIMRSYHLRNDCSWTADSSGVRDSCSALTFDAVIADGLILEKIGSNEVWQHQHTLYSSDDAMKQFPPSCSLLSTKDEPKTGPARDNSVMPNKNHDHFCIEHEISLTNINPNYPRHNSPPRKKDVMVSDNKTSEISLNEKNVETLCSEVMCDVGHHIPMVMDIESPTDNLNPVSAIPSEVPNMDENDNKSNNSYEYGSSDEDRISSATTPHQNSDILHISCVGTPPLKAKNKPVSPRKELLGDFDVYNIETTMPTIDWVAMEAHLTRAAAEDDWFVRRRNDREEIRKKLAMDSDTEDYYCGERVTRKPSLSTRLQSGMNLQICFMNETASDQESQGSDHDTDGGHSDLNCANQRTPTPPSDRINKYFSNDDQNSPLTLHCEMNSQVTNSNNSNRVTSVTEKNTVNSQNVLSNGNATHKKQRPSFFFARQKSWRLRPKQKESEDQEEKGKNTTTGQSYHNGRLDPAEDFYTRHARLQAEARMALAQAKEMARMQMEVERQKSKKSPIADIVGLPFPDNRHRLSRQFLTDMNVAQLQVIVNDLHTQIENLNEDLVQLLLTRDDLHMEQDSMLVDIEDLTRYFRAKDEAQQKQSLSVGQCKSTSKK